MLAHRTYGKKAKAKGLKPDKARIVHIAEGCATMWKKAINDTRRLSPFVTFSWEHPTGVVHKQPWFQDMITLNLRRCRACARAAKALPPNRQQPNRRYLCASFVAPSSKKPWRSSLTSPTSQRTTTSAPPARRASGSRTSLPTSIPRGWSMPPRQPPTSQASATF